MEFAPAVDGKFDGGQAARQMLLMHAIDEALTGLVASRSDEILNGTVLHPYTGLEAISVGTALARRPGDAMFASHRGFGHCLAWGMDPQRAIEEVLGREGGYARGRGGHMHLISVADGIGGTNGIVGGQLPLAVGAAKALRDKDSDNVVVSFMGDGASNTGAFHEAINMACVWQLPLVMVCENNNFSEAMVTAEITAAPSLAARAAAYDVATWTVDGFDAEQVFGAASEAFDHAREKCSPAFVECTLVRPKGHYAGDNQHYRDPDERDQAKDYNLTERLAAFPWAKDLELAEVAASAMQRADELVTKALAANAPSPDSLTADYEASKV
jgi:TPP-dependent pyruvate/acetoin dehydrogenase alpha subunit